jgi:type IV secretory pathway TrbL component
MAEPSYGHVDIAVDKMLAKITSVISTFDATLQPVFLITGVILFGLACAKFMYTRDLSPWAAFVVRYVQLMAVITASSQWQGLANGYVDQMGSFAANAAGFDILQMSPSNVLLKGLQTAWKIYEENVSWMRLLFGSAEDNIAHLLLLIGCLGTILLSIFMASWLLMFLIAFKLACAVALLFLAFLMFDATRFMAAPGLARILAYGVQMLVTALICGLYFMTLDILDLSGHLEVSQSIALLTIMFAFALLFSWTNNIAREQISGMPSLDFHDGARALGAAGSMLSAMAVPAMGALGAFGGARMAGIGAQQAAGAAASAAMPQGGAGGAAGGASSALSRMSGMSGEVMSGGAGGGRAPASARRMLESPMMEGSWTEARDLPKSATRMLTNEQGRLPYPTRDGTWTDARDLPAPNRGALPPPPSPMLPSPR